MTASLPILATSSRIAGFYQRPLAERVATVAALADAGLLSAASAACSRTRKPKPASPCGAPPPAR